eukprot:11907043-Alexandrium_andersonii.AAC.1
MMLPASGERATPLGKGRPRARPRDVVGPRPGPGRGSGVRPYGDERLPLNGRAGEDGMGIARLQDRPRQTNPSGAGPAFRGRRPDRPAETHLITFEGGRQGERPGGCDAPKRQRPTDAALASKRRGRMPGG